MVSRYPGVKSFERTVDYHATVLDPTCQHSSLVSSLRADKGALSSIEQDENVRQIQSRTDLAVG